MSETDSPKPGRRTSGRPWRPPGVGTPAASPEPPTVASPAEPASGRDLASLLTAKPSLLFKAGFFAAAGVLAALALASVLGSLKGILIVLTVALFVALGLQPVIEWLVKRGVRRTLAAGLVTLGLFGFLVGALWAVVPMVAEQASTFAENGPGYLAELRSNPLMAKADAQFGIIDKVSEQLSSGSLIGGLFGGFTAFGLAAANAATSAALTTVLVLFFTFSAPAIKDAIYELAPASKRPRVRYLAGEVFGRIGDYLLSMVLVVGLWGVGSFITLNVVGLGKYALALALITMVLTAIPAVGSFAAMGVCSLIALSVSPGAALGTLAYFLVYQQLDAYLVQPRLFARSLKVPPALVILGVACGMALLGVLGALLAIPFVASLLLLYREVLVPRLDAS